MDRNYSGLQLSDQVAVDRISALLDTTPEAVRAQLDANPLVKETEAVYRQTPHNLIDMPRYNELRKELVALADRHGFPHRPKGSFRQFDTEAGHILHRMLPMSTAEASSPQAWSYITLSVMPDLAMWRFPNKDKKPTFERWMGGSRNTFYKLWWAVEILGPELSASIGEDETVGIIERPTFGGNPVVARAIVEALHATFPTFDGPRSELLRIGARRLRRYAAFIDFDMLTEEEMLDLAMEVFMTACTRPTPKD